MYNMVKFLKFVLFVIILAFAFALGVKFSDSFKGNVGNLNDDEINIENEIDKSFNDAKEELYRVVDNHDVDNNAPLTEEEKNDVKNIEAPEYVDIEVVQPMDNIDDAEINSNNMENMQPSQDFNNNEQHTVIINSDSLDNQPVTDDTLNNSNQHLQIETQPNGQMENQQPVQPTAVDAAQNNAISDNMAPTNSQAIVNK